MKPLVSNPETKQEEGKKVDKLEEIEMAKWDFYSWPPVSAGEISCRADITLIAGTRERRSRDTSPLPGPLMATIAGLVCQVPLKSTRI